MLQKEKGCQRAWSHPPHFCEDNSMLAVTPPHPNVLQTLYVMYRLHVTIVFQGERILIST